MFRNPAAFRPRPAHVPPQLWSVLHRPARLGLTWLTTGLLPAHARQILGEDWTNNDRRALTASSAAIRHAWPLIPEHRRYHPRAAAGIARTRNHA